MLCIHKKNTHEKKITMETIASTLSLTLHKQKINVWVKPFGLGRRRATGQAYRRTFIDLPVFFRRVFDLTYTEKKKQQTRLQTYTHRTTERTAHRLTKTLAQYPFRMAVLWQLVLYTGCRRAVFECRWRSASSSVRCVYHLYNNDVVVSG